MSDPVAEQLNFESMWDAETLNEPLHTDDADQLGEVLANLQTDIRLMFTKCRRQYNGDTWISNELWAAYMISEMLWDKLQFVYDHGGFDRPNGGPG
jgi:hypothetical protein